MRNSCSVSGYTSYTWQTVVAGLQAPGPRLVWWIGLNERVHLSLASGHTDETYQSRHTNHGFDGLLMHTNILIHQCMQDDLTKRRSLQTGTA